MYVNGKLLDFRNPAVWRQDFTGQHIVQYINFKLHALNLFWMYLGLIGIQLLNSRC